jgi:hypothetical protein
MADKPTTVTATAPTGRVPFGKTSNPTDLVFPVDSTGFTTVLRKEGARAVGRIGGDPARLEVYLKTLRVLGDHAKTKLEAQKAGKAAVAKAVADRAAEAALSAAQDEADEVIRLEAVIASATADLAARKAE